MIHPTVSGVSIITTDQVWVLFDRELDESSLSNGNFFVTGPDFDTWSGPDLQLFHDVPSVGDESEILQSAGYHGFINGDFTFKRIEVGSLDATSGLDVIGSGILFRTKAIFTPTHRLESNTQYTVHLSGDEDDTDTLKTGITGRTVFDTVASGLNTSSGTATFTGGYTGNVNSDIFHVTISTAGSTDTARFTWWRETAPSVVFGPLRTRRSGTLLTEGVSVSFTEGNYSLNDIWYAVVKGRQIFSGNFIWPFTTGGGNIEEVPDDISTSVIGDPISTSSVTAATTFSVLSTEPENQDTNYTISAGEFPIVISFDDNIDSSTVISGITTSIFAESVNGDPSIAASGELTHSTSVSGKTLQLNVPYGLIKQNNAVTVTLDSTLSNTDGIELGSDYSFWFTTTYSPLYCSTRQVKLDIGAFLTDIIDDTINAAIFEASLETDAITFNYTSATTDYYYLARRKWVCCKASEVLLMNVTGGSNSLKSKRLGDLSVEYNTSAKNDAIDRSLACQAKWEPVLKAGGYPTITPIGVVKGELEPDRPIIGRLWAQNTSNPSLPVSNTKDRWDTSRRRFINTHNRWDPGHYPGGKRGRNW